MARHGLRGNHVRKGPGGRDRSETLHLTGQRSGLGEISTFAGDVTVHRTQDTNLEMAVRCMKARGYTLVKTEDR